MKKLITIITAFLIIQIVATAQNPTRDEAEQWVKEIIENYVPSDDKSSIVNTTKVQFLPNLALLMINIKSTGPLGWNFESTTTIPIRKIVSVRIVPYNDNYNVVISTSGDQDISRLDNYSMKEKFVGVSKDIPLSKKIEEENLKNRLIKAFKFIVSEYGGEIKSDPF